jgi:myo-inositol 2-dehydrogenase / D-chiro-inositol 1-dehydrogenase
MKSLAFGLIGYGAWGKCHAEAIRHSADCKLTAVCARTDAARAQARRDTGATIYVDYRELVRLPELDVVDIVAPNYLHEQMAVAALEAGKHVLLEKPMATALSSCDRIIDAARRSGRLLLVGHEMRFSPMHALIHSLVEGGRLGTPRYVLIDLWRRPYRPGADGWRMDPKRVGNWILEEPVHFFDAAGWFLRSEGQPSAIYARGNHARLDVPYDTVENDNFTAIVDYPNGAYASISQALDGVEHHLSIKVFGSKAMLRAEWHAEMDRSERPSYSLEVSEGSSLQKLAVPGTPGELFELREEIAALARAARGEAQLPITPEEARQAVMLCLKAQESLESHREILLS